MYESRQVFPKRDGGQGPSVGIDPHGGIGLVGAQREAPRHTGGRVGLLYQVLRYSPGVVPSCVKPCVSMVATVSGLMPCHS